MSYRFEYPECHPSPRLVRKHVLSHAAIELVFWAGMRGGDCTPSAKRRASVFDERRVPAASSSCGFGSER